MWVPYQNTTIITFIKLDYTQFHTTFQQQTIVVSTRVSWIYAQPIVGMVLENCKWVNLLKPLTPIVSEFPEHPYSDNELQVSFISKEITANKIIIFLLTYILGMDWVCTSEGAPTDVSRVPFAWSPGVLCLRCTSASLALVYRGRPSSRLVGGCGWSERKGMCLSLTLLLVSLTTSLVVKEWSSLRAHDEKERLTMGTALVFNSTVLDPILSFQVLPIITLLPPPFWFCTW